MAPSRTFSLDGLLAWSAFLLLALHFALVIGKVAGHAPLSHRTGELVLGAGLACLGAMLLRDRRGPLPSRLTGAAVLGLGAWSLLTVLARMVR